MPANLCDAKGSRTELFNGDFTLVMFLPPLQRKMKHFCVKKKKVKDTPAWRLIYISFQIIFGLMLCIFFLMNDLEVLLYKKKMCPRAEDRNGAGSATSLSAYLHLIRGKKQGERGWMDATMLLLGLFFFFHSLSKTGRASVPGDHWALGSILLL